MDMLVISRVSEVLVQHVLNIEGVFADAHAQVFVCRKIIRSSLLVRVLKVCRCAGERLKHLYKGRWFRWCRILASKLLKLCWSSQDGRGRVFIDFLYIFGMYEVGDTVSALSSPGSVISFAFCSRKQWICRSRKRRRQVLSRFCLGTGRSIQN